MAGENKHQVAQALGLRVEDGSPVMDSKSLIKSVGGRLGIAESVLPSFLFLMLWLTTKSPVVAVSGASLPVVGFGIFRLVKRAPITQVFSGAVVAGFSAWMALRPGGETRDLFITGLLTNLAYFAVLAVSVLIRWPLVGLALGFLLGHGTKWRRNKAERSPYTAATLALTSVFAIRLVVEVPLYLANELVALGVVKIVLGLPLFALGLWTSWLMVRKVFVS